VVFGLTLPGIQRGVPEGALEGARVVLLDWDIVSLSQGGVAAWLDHVRQLTLSWYYRLKPLRGLPQAHIEPAGNAPSIIETARLSGFVPTEISTDFVKLGKDGRALAVEPHASQGRLKIGTTAFEKRESYRGVTANHLVRQVTGFRAFDKDSYRREDDLFDAAMYAALVSIGSGIEARWARLRGPELKLVAE
jgi:hypothetical protein